MTEPHHANTVLLNVSLDALSHPYRRRILARLHDHNPREEASFTIDSVADDTDDDRVAIEIHHHHLPKLAEDGFVDWDRDADVVRRGPRFDEIAPLIELMAKHPDELPSGWP